MLIPIMEAWVFAGRKLDRNDEEENHLYFQDVGSYREGIRYDSATDENSCFQIATENVKHIFDYEHALDLLLMCSLRRKKASC